MNVWEFDSIGEDETFPFFSKSKVSQNNVSGLFPLQKYREKHIYWIKNTNKKIKTNKKPNNNKKHT